MNLEELKKDCSKKQKKGIHFIIASIVIWTMVLIIQLTNLPVLTKNLLTFCCTAPLLPINKKSINILLYCTIITNSFFNIQNIKNTISR